MGRHGRTHPFLLSLMAAQPDEDATNEPRSPCLLMQFIVVSNERFMTSLLFRSTSKQSQTKVDIGMTRPQSSL